MIPAVTKIDNIVDNKRTSAIARSEIFFFQAPGVPCPKAGPTEFLANDNCAPQIDLRSRAYKSPGSWLGKGVFNTMLIERLTNR